MKIKKPLSHKLRRQINDLIKTHFRRAISRHRMPVTVNGQTIVNLRGINQCRRALTHDLKTVIASALAG